MRTEDRQVVDQLQKAKRILITFREHYSGDALASALALYLFLQKAGKKVHICNANFNDPRIFGFLPGVKDIRAELKTDKKFIISLATESTGVKDVTYRREDGKLEFSITPEDGGSFRHEHISSHTTGHHYDVLITVGTPDLESLGDIYQRNTDFFFAVPMINIDHEPENEAYGQINIINITALATAEIVFDVLKEYSTQYITPEVATCLLTGIMAESKSFKVGSLTPRSLVAAGDLLELGADRERIVRHLYQNRDLATLKLWGRVLAKLQHGHAGKLVWSTLNKADFEKTNSTPDALSDVVEELVVNIPEAQLIVIFSEDPATGATQAMLVATKRVHAGEVAKHLGGTGDKHHAVVTSTKSLVDLEVQVIAHLTQQLEKLPV